LSLVYSLGFDFADLGPGTLPETDHTITFLRLGVPVHSFIINRPHGVSAFVGVGGDALFDRVEIREPNGDADNEAFGQFYIGTAPIPEPSTYLLFTCVIAGMIVVSKRKPKVN